VTIVVAGTGVEGAVTARCNITEGLGCWPFAVALSPSALYALRISCTRYGGGFLNIGGRLMAIKLGAVTGFRRAKPEVFVRVPERLETIDGANAVCDVVG